MLELYHEVIRAEREASSAAPAQILLWQHDGLTLAVRQRRDYGLWVRRMTAALDRGCRRLERHLGIPTVFTTLEVAHDPR